MEPSTEHRPGVYQVVLTRSDGDVMGFFIGANSEMEAHGKALEMSVEIGWLSGGRREFECRINSLYVPAHPSTAEPMRVSAPALT